MNRIISLLALLTLATLNVSAQPTIFSPTNGQTLYVGDTVEIRWQSNTNPWPAKQVSIGQQDQHYGTMGWIAFAAPNNGSFTWTVGKWTTSEKFTIWVSDGGNYTNSTFVTVIIPNGPRPKPVPSVIKQVVSVEWYADPTRTYRVESSGDLTNWATAYEGQSAGTNGMAAFYTLPGTNTFFRVLDVGP